jgi:homoserine dehydrogenase
MTTVALIGFGVVGQSFARVLSQKQQELKDNHGLDARIVAISGRSKGSLMVEEGIDLERLLTSFEENGTVELYPTGIKGLDSIQTIKRSRADVVVEVTGTNLETGEPGLSHIREALGLGKHVITCNKGPPALAYNELKELADAHGVKFRIESTVMAGTPAVNLGMETLAGNKILGFKGIINGTTNYILTKMEQGGDYDTALREAQELGYAEADPTGDVEGWDAVGKVVILANTLMGAHLKPSGVEREGITGITPAMIEEAKRENMRIKLIAQALIDEGVVKGKVAPEMVPMTDPLAIVNGTMNALTFTTDGLHEVTVIGRGAGGVETAHGIISDLIAIYRGH